MDDPVPDDLPGEHLPSGDLPSGDLPSDDLPDDLPSGDRPTDDPSDDLASGDLASAPEDGPGRISTCCHACGGAGWIPQPVLTLHHQYAHTSTYAKPCPWCDDGRLPGIVPPV